ncbi:MAG TPA: YceH family protein [Holophagaceae bacterium]|nr:YceH family protein [Holophagaceae bacterium]
MSLPLLDPLECRVLGCLLEKQLSTPDTYPLSLNALTNACNQSSNRDPVLQVGEAEAEAAVEALVERGLGERWPGRAMKYAHLAKQAWHLSEQEAAVLAELLLRGPQTPGELRTNCKRMYAFADLAEVEAALQSLMEAEGPLALRLAKAPGAREARVAHLLGGPVDAEAPLPAAALPARRAGLEAEVAALRGELAALRAEFEAFKGQF